MATTPEIERKTRVRLTQSGQITLPARIRRQLGIEIGDYVTISESADGTVSIEPDRLLNLDEIMAMAVEIPKEVELSQLLREARQVGTTSAMRSDSGPTDDRR